MARKKRNKNRYKKKTREDHEYYRISMRSFQAEKAREEELENDIQDSTAITNARLQDEAQVTIFAHNLHFRASAADLAKALAKNLESRNFGPMPILRCEIKRQRYGQNKGKSNGTGQILLSSKAVFEHLQNRQAEGLLQLLGRKFAVKENKTRPLQSAKSLGCHTHKINSLQIGLPLNDINSERPTFEVAQQFWELEMEWDAQKAKSFVIYFKVDDVRLKMEFELRNLINFSIHRDKNSMRVVSFDVKYPPDCYRESGSSASYAELVEKFSKLYIQSKKVSSITQQKEIAGAYSDYVWDASGYETEWTRTPVELFGKYPCYRLICWQVESRADEKFVQTLNDFSFKSQKEIKTSDYSWILLSDGWAQGYEECFKNMTFDKKYMIHCFLSTNLIYLTNKKDAEAIATTCQEVSAELLADIFTFKRQNWGNGVKWLLERIKSEKDEEFVEFSVEYTKRVYITPTRICPQPPDAELSNRIIRQFQKYKDRFIRVTFVDENFGSVLQARSDEIFDRMKDLLSNGISVAGHKFVFLAYSNSQLREQGCWIYDEEPHGTQNPPTASEIRASMGDLSGIKIVGKHAARLAQGFSNSRQTVDLQPHEFKIVGDVESRGYCFSDGCGTISSELATQICEKLGENGPISAFQIRFGGAKGVVSVDSRLKGIKMILRESMHKFKGSEDHRNVEVLAISRGLKCYLNRQAIVLLSSLGIKDDIFVKKLKTQIHELDICLQDNDAAKRLSLDFCPVAYKMLDAGFDVRKELFLQNLIEAVRQRRLLDLQVRARIEVPKGITLVGILDEYGLLESGEVFFQFSESLTKKPKILNDGTEVAVYRCPCLHPGDIRLLKFKNHKEFSHLVDVVVFPQKGERPHPNEMSGGDLDGDIYNIIMDPDLIPKTNFPPMQYTAPESPPEQDKIDVSDIINSFVNYIKNDNLGRIANAHCVFADSNDLGAKSLECLKLAELHSISVDFCKTGIPAKYPSDLVVRKYPDFMNKKPKQTYKSEKVLGKMYRLVKNTRLRDYACNLKIDKSLLMLDNDEYQEEAIYQLLEYNKELLEITNRFGAESEGEVLAHCVRRFSRLVSRNREKGNDAQERLNHVLSDLLEDFKERFWYGLQVEDPQEIEGNRALKFEAYRKISAWYKVAYEEGLAAVEQGLSPFLSFAWILPELLCDVKNLNEGFDQEQVESPVDGNNSPNTAH
eukprot:NODE_211_length_12764_cov_0.923727.p1 type:complete len:1193 gc:universal NODE_211_length_12764_cov_0.923727:10212-6634(-)